jgi:spore cortex biosynthesis protein YabQ
MTLTVQFNTMIVMALMGMVIGMSFYTYNRLVPAKSQWYWIRFVNDSMFWIIQGLLVFWALLEVNNGEIRFYIFLALLCGFAAYKGLLESYYKKFLEVIIRAIIRCYFIVKKIIEVLLIKPIYALLKLLLYLVKMIGSIVLTIVVFIFGILYKPIKWIALKLWGKIPVKIVSKINWIAGFFIGIANKVKKWFRD